MHTLAAILLAGVLGGGTPPLREGAVAVSPLNPRLVLAAAIRVTTTSNYDIALFRSSDGGQTWTALGTLPKQLAGNAVSSFWDPVLAFDRSGRAYLAVVAANEPRWMIGLYRSTDSGTTWTGSVVSSPSANRNDKPWIALDEHDAIHVAWGQFGSPFGLAYSVSRDRGVTFAAPRVFTPSVGWPYIATGGDGNVYLAHTPAFSVYEVIRSADGGATFGTPVPVATEVGQDPQQLAAYRNHVYAVIAATDGIRFTRSSDFGATWTPAVKLSGENGGMMGSVAVDSKNGELVITWLEKDGFGRSQLLTRRSTDNGATLSDPRSVGAPIAAQRPVGEYNQLAAQSGIHVAVYADEAGVFSAQRLDNNPTPQPPAPRRRAVKR